MPYEKAIVYDEVNWEENFTSDERGGYSWSSTIGQSQTLVLGSFCRRFSNYVGETQSVNFDRLLSCGNLVFLRKCLPIA